MDDETKLQQLMGGMDSAFDGGKIPEFTIKDELQGLSISNPGQILPGGGAIQGYWGSNPGTIAYPGSAGIYPGPLHTKENIMDEVAKLHYRISDIHAQIERLIGVVAEMNKLEKGERRKLPEVEKKS